MLRLPGCSMPGGFQRSIRGPATLSAVVVVCLLYCAANEVCASLLAFSTECSVCADLPALVVCACACRCVLAAVLYFWTRTTHVLLLALFLLLSYSNQRSVLIVGVDRGPVDARRGFAQPFCEHHGSRDFVCPCHHRLLPGDQQAPLHRQWRRASPLPHPLPRPVWNVYKLERFEC